MDVIERLKQLKLVPVATIEEPEDALELGKILVEEGLPVLEITFRTEAAATAIATVTKEIPELLMGAGTVLKVDQVKSAVKAGAKFIVTPGFNPTVVDYCVKNKIPIVPGLNTPTMVEWALERGIGLVKFFPADLSGGPKMIQTLSGPYPTMKFMPTGGINEQSLVEYLKLKNVAACGGSWFVNKELIAAGNFEEIRNRTKKAVSLIIGS